MQNELDIVRDVSARLDRAGIGYMLTGSMAMNYYAQPRMTRDIDVVVALILQPVGLKVGDAVIAGPNVDILTGNCLPLKNIPQGTMVHNVELKPGKGGQMARSAGASVQVVAKEGDYVSVKMPSGEIRKIYQDCLATIGQVGNIDHENVSIGKAGRSRWLGKRPHVRGVAMNPVDHPLGGGEGKTSGGRHPVTPWGVPTKGYKTRRPQPSDKFIVQRRSK